jgi:diguanylate cyclase (GGDEF) domain
MASTPDLLFEFLRNIIYDPAIAELDIEYLDEEYRDLGLGLISLNKMLKEKDDFLNAIAKGDLSHTPPSKDNVMASSVKALHASLRHLTWQTQKVAEGDYQQKVDFMGEFSDSFNTMITQLDTRQNALKLQIQRDNERSLALEQSNKFFLSISETISLGIIVANLSSKKILYSNSTAEKALNLHENLTDFLIDNYSDNTSDPIEISFEVNENIKTRYYTLKVFSINWNYENAKLFLLEDVTTEKLKRLELEFYATRDSLTGVNNRYAGMRNLFNHFEHDKAFTLAFIDLDNLKFVNDVLGHAEGDHYIKYVSEKLSGIMPEIVVSRIGGDEFMVLAPDTSKENILDLLSEVRLNMMANKDAVDKGYVMSFSYGAVQDTEAKDVSLLLSIADDRMYTYKREYKKSKRNDT